jgi:hypothetical protein
LEEAKRIVLSAYPECQFYEADGTPTGGQGTSSEKVKEWRFVFNHPRPGQTNGAVFLPYRDGSFVQPTIIAYPWVGDVLITQPVRLELEEAILLKDLAGYNEPFSSVVLRWPLYPGVNEPSYIFTDASNGKHIFVGVNSLLVSTQHGTRKLSRSPVPQEATARVPPHYVNQQVLMFANDHFGQQVGDGECSTLAATAVAEAGGKPFSELGPSGPDSDYVWGVEIATLTPFGGSVADVQPGDIIQFRSVQLTLHVETRYPDGHYSTTTTLQSYAHHTAIVSDLQGSLIDVLQQSVNGNRTVQKGTIWGTSHTTSQTLPDGTKIITTYSVNGGTMWVYRPYA